MEHSPFWLAYDCRISKSAITMKDENPGFSLLIKEVRDLRAKGIENVKLEVLEKALLQAQELEKSNATGLDVLSPAKIQELQFQSNLAAYNWRAAEAVKLLEAVFQFSASALKSALLINGGAAVAVLAYLGKDKVPSVECFASSLRWFAFGVLAAAMANGMSYVTQSCFTYASDAWGKPLRIVCVGVIVFSYLCFAMGVLWGHLGFMS